MRKTFMTIATLALVACSPKADNANSDSAADSAGQKSNSGEVTVAMRDSAGKDLGTLTLSDTQDGIMIMGSLKGLAPGDHAIHLHTTGACTPNFAAAGGHWNPTNKEHGKDSPNGPHMGDMPNITVGADGTVTGMVTSPGGSLRGANALLDADGAAVVIHAKADDYKSQPAGNAGDRVACGEAKGT